MDAATLGQYSGYIALLISIGAMIIGAINHKRIRSNCCGREGTVSLDISPTTPPDNKPAVIVQMPYKVVEVKGGYKVKKDQPGRATYFSKEPLTKAKAEAQLRALYAAERRR